MGVAIILRTSQTNNFRNTLLSVISDPKINKVFMTYPYFYENKPYQKDGLLYEGKYSVLGDNAVLASNPLKNSLQECILSRDDFTLVTFCSQRAWDWRESYKNFVHKLDAQIKQSKKNICLKPFYGDTRNEYDSRLHAKIFIACSDNKPGLLVIGSSNLTNKAFGVFPDFNIEADVVLWDEEIYNFDSSILKTDELVPIIATANTKGVEKQYIEYFYSRYYNYFKDNFHDVKFNDNNQE